MAPTKLTIKNTNLNQGQQHLLSIYSISVHSFTRGMVWKWNCETGDALSRVLLFWCCAGSRSATGNVVDWHGRGGQNRRVNTRHLFSGSIVLHMKFISTSIGRIYYKNNPKLEWPAMLVSLSLCHRHCTKEHIMQLVTASCWDNVNFFKRCTSNTNRPSLCLSGSFKCI